MNHQTMLKDIKADLDHLDPAALQSIREIINQAKRPLSYAPDTNRSPAKPLIDIKTVEDDSLHFVGKNLTPEEHEKLSIKEKCWRKRTLKEQNQQWLRVTFEKLGAAWLVVIDGKVIAFGKSLKDQPMQPQIRKICQRIGKFPLVFVNEDFIIIEETISAWHTTNEPGDFYPTLPVIFNSTSGVIEVIGDFDTAKVYCVLSWRKSPFVTANPNRIALVGRDIMLELKPKVLLDFEKRQTEILPAVKPRRTRQKSSGVYEFSDLNRSAML